MEVEKEKEPAKSSTNWGENFPKPPAMIEPLVEPKEEEIDWSIVEFPKFVFEPD